MRVSVTPLLPLRFDRRQRYVDRITNIVRIADAAGACQADAQGPDSMKITDIGFGDAARAAEDAVQDRAAHGRRGSRTSW